MGKGETIAGGPGRFGGILIQIDQGLEFGDALFGAEALIAEGFEICTFDRQEIFRAGVTFFESIEFNLQPIEIDLMEIFAEFGQGERETFVVGILL